MRACAHTRCMKVHRPTRNKSATFSKQAMLRMQQWWPPDPLNIWSTPRVKLRKSFQASWDVVIKWKTPPSGDRYLLRITTFLSARSNFVFQSVPINLWTLLSHCLTFKTKCGPLACQTPLDPPPFLYIKHLIYFDVNGRSSAFMHYRKGEKTPK
jgi:hypothetical protein